MFNNCLKMDLIQLNRGPQQRCNDMHRPTIDAQKSSSASGQMTFKDFCQSTSLHGWQYLGGLEYQKR